LSSSTRSNWAPIGRSSFTATCALSNARAKQFANDSANTQPLPARRCFHSRNRAELVRETIMNDANQTTAVVRKRKAAWDGIRLEHCELRPGELPRHRHREHVILLSLTDGCRGELITGSGIGVSGTQAKGNVCVVPAGLDHQAVLEDNSEHLALYLDPSLIAKAAAEAQVAGSFEIAERYTRRDPVINSVGMALLGELESEGLSGRLYAESLGNVLAVHLLRYYSVPSTRPVTFTGGLSAAKLRQVTNFISDNYGRDIKLAELAQV